MADECLKTKIQYIENNLLPTLTNIRLQGADTKQQTVFQSFLKATAMNNAKTKKTSTVNAATDTG